MRIPACPSLRRYPPVKCTIYATFWQARTLSISGKSHVGRRLRIGVGADVNKCRLATLDGALNRRPDRTRLLDEFTVAAKRFDHLVISLEAQIATDAAASFARSESAVVRNHHNDRQLMANHRIHLHTVPAECAVSAEHQHREVRTRHLRSDSERDANAHASVRP